MSNRFIYILIFTGLILSSCVNGVEEIERIQKTDSDEENLRDLYEYLDRNNHSVEEEIEDETVQNYISETEKNLIEAGLVNIQDIDSSIKVNVLYATDNNFMNYPIYDDYDKVYLQNEVAERLAKAQSALKEIDSTLSLIVMDGARPRSVQQYMWDALDTVPFNERTKFLSNPANGSIHNYGCAVDLTIIDLKTGYWLDMGAGYDDMRKIAYPRHEEEFLKSGELTIEQVENRKLLRKVMKAGGFWVIQTEWWHFNAYTREKAKSLFPIIE